jgi:hypothetical protein
VNIHLSNIQYHEQLPMLNIPWNSFSPSG